MEMIERVAAGRRVLQAASPEAKRLLLLPEGALLVAANPLHLLLHAHPGPAAVHSAQLLLHCAARSLLAKHEIKADLCLSSNFKTSSRTKAVLTQRHGVKKTKKRKKKEGELKLPKGESH